MRWLGIADKRTRFDLAVGEILVPVSASDSVWFDLAVGEILVPFRFGSSSVLARSSSHGPHYLVGLVFSQLRFSSVRFVAVVGSVLSSP